MISINLQNLRIWVLLVLAAIMSNSSIVYAAADGDCNDNGILDTLELDTDGDTVIDPCDNCSL